MPPELATWGGLLGSHDTSHPILTMEAIDSKDEEGLGGNTSGQAASHLLPPEGEHGPFNSLQELLNHAAHLAIFLHYVILDKDPAPLLFYLVTDAYKAGSVKKMRKWAYEIHISFLVTRSQFLSSIHSTDAFLSALLELPNLELPMAGRVGTPHWGAG